MCPSRLVIKGLLHPHSHLLACVCQCLRQVPELRNALSEYKPDPSDPRAALTATLGRTYDEADASTEEKPVPPMLFLGLLRQLNPTFAHRNERGAYSQQVCVSRSRCAVSTSSLTLFCCFCYSPPQDADEFLGAVMSAMASCLNTKTSKVPDFGGESNAVDALFGIRTVTR